MRKISLVIILLLFSVDIAAALSDRPFRQLNDAPLVQPATSEFTFIVFGDFRTLRRDRPYPPVLNQILNEIRIVGPSFVVSTGDAYYGYGGSFQRFKNEIDYFLSAIRPFDSPFYNVIGNHEVTGDPERENYVKERGGASYGSFDFGSSHFVMLNTEEGGREGSITGEQLKWLEKDLEENSGADNIFVFFHRPLFSVIDPDLAKGKSFRDRENRDGLHALFRRHNVRAVIAGHEHLFSDTVRDGIRYIIAGGGGAPLYQSPATGGFFHYLVVKVNGRNVGIEVLEPYGLVVRTLFGNDGFEPKGDVEVMNLTHADLDVKNLSLTLPLADADRYRVKAVIIPARTAPEDHPAAIRRVKDNGNGTATVSVETRLPKNGVIRVSVEVDI